MYPTAMPDYMGWMMFGSYIFWFALIALGVFAILRLSRAPRSDARWVLEQRLARGEINEEEFRARLAVIGS